MFLFVYHELYTWYIPNTWTFCDVHPTPQAKFKRTSIAKATQHIKLKSKKKRQQKNFVRTVLYNTLIVALKLVFYCFIYTFIHIIHIYRINQNAWNLKGCLIKTVYRIQACFNFFHRFPVLSAASHLYYTCETRKEYPIHTKNRHIIHY